MEAKGSKFSSVVQKVDFAREEEKILQHWNEIKAFETSLKLSQGRKEYTFYDGPPFATGLPHYGHLLAGTIKDAVTRYAHMTGHHVERRFGWDCHGLPVEYEIDQKLGIKSRDDVMKMGVAAYNAECRSIVQRYTHEWEERVSRMGRWIDFKNDYKTMDLKFMESVWWVFSQMFNKGLVYRGFKVMPYSTACTTPLSNFEANLNYKNVRDPAIVITFPLESEPGTSMLAWTTTPWTLPSNLALCVNPNMNYVKVRDLKTNNVYIIAESRLNCLYPGGGKAPKFEPVLKGKNEEDLYADSNESADDAPKYKEEGKKEEKKDAPKKDAAKKDSSKKDASKKDAPKKDASKKDAPKKEAGKKDDKKADKTEKNEKPAEKNKETKKEEKKEEVKEYEILGKMTGAQLKGLTYQPLFPYFANLKTQGAFKIVADNYVTEDSGTGVVHCAPAFGEDDYRVCIEGGVIKKGEALVCPIDANGKFLPEVKEFAGRYVKEADLDIIRLLKKNGRLVHQGQIDHSYPFCWRSETPLLYRAVPSWFVAVEKIKEQLLANNAQTYWVPAFVKEKRFQRWLQDARDWAISRNRYWGTPLPIWASDDGEEIVVVGSVEELTRLSGVQNITDIHKDKIDHITIPSKKGKGALKRVEEVFDCWFESGSMPYAQQHYPFENKERFESAFPADFIAEGLDQTRGWFYTLMVISTALFNKPPFRNLIVNGLVLAADGKKMSKRLKNYPDPMEVVHRYGADALRLYLINSPVVRAEPLRFQEEGVRDIVKNVFLPWYHAFRFFLDNVVRFEHVYNKRFQADKNVGTVVTNVMDKWILASLQSLIEYVRNEMTPNYRLYTVVPRLVDFIDQLTNWYVRMNRKRFKGIRSTAAETEHALAVLFEVLYSLTRLMAPFCPFLVDFMYQYLKPALEQKEQVDSVHYLFVPEPNNSLKNPAIERAIGRMQQAIVAGRACRDNRTLSLKQPLHAATIVHQDKAVLDDIRPLEAYIRDELNVRRVEFSSDVRQFVRLVAEPNKASLGKKLGPKLNEFVPKIQALSHDELSTFLTSGSVIIGDTTFGRDDILTAVKFIGDASRYESASSAFTSAGDAKDAKDTKDSKDIKDAVMTPKPQTDNLLVVVDVQLDAELVQEKVAREFVNRVQRLRKQSGLNASDRVEVFYRVVTKDQVASDEKAAKPASEKKAAKPASEKKGEKKPQKPKDDEKKVVAPKVSVADALAAKAAFVKSTLHRNPVPLHFRPSHGFVTLGQTFDSIDEEKIELVITRVGIFVPPAMPDLSPAQASSLRAYLLSLDWDNLSQTLTQNGGKLTLHLDGKQINVQRGVHFFLTGDEALAASK